MLYFILLSSIISLFESSFSGRIFYLYRGFSVQIEEGCIVHKDRSCTFYATVCLMFYSSNSFHLRKAHFNSIPKNLCKTSSGRCVAMATRFFPNMEQLNGFPSARLCDLVQILDVLLKIILPHLVSFARKSYSLVSGCCALNHQYFSLQKTSPIISSTVAI